MSHPNAASVNTISTDTLQSLQAPNRIAAGDIEFINTRARSEKQVEADVAREDDESFADFLAFLVLLGFGVTISLLWGKLGSLNPINVRGVQRRPMSRESEKFKVASAERKRPSNSREKDFNRRNCCGVGAFRNLVRIVAKAKGRRRLMKVKQ